MSDDIERHLAALARYRAVFGEEPPIFRWKGTNEELEKRMAQAIERGSPLTFEELGGGPPLPLDSVT